MLWKYYKNIVNITLFFKFLPRFRQQHFFFLPFSAMTLPQFHSIFFPIFGNAVATITKKVFFFFLYFGNGIAAITFFFFLSTPHSGTQDTRPGKNLGRGISVTALPKFLFFLSPTFSLSLSYFCWVSATLLPNFFLFPQFPI